MRIFNVCLAASLIFVVPILAAQSFEHVDSAASTAGVDQPQRSVARVQAKLARAQAIADRFTKQAASLGYSDNAWRYELVNNLMRADDVSSAAIESSADLAAAMRAASSAAAAASVAQPKVLGDGSDDLVYTPITPCRIVDTRNPGAGGVFAAKETRTYNYAGSTAQGGTACVSSTVTPAALAVNVTIQTVGLGDPTVSGFLSVFPEGGSKTTSWMNYYGGEIVANAGVTTINEGTGNFSVFAQNPTYVIVDVFGVLRPPVATGALNAIPKWTPNAATLGQSRVVDDGFHIGIGVSSPANLLQIGSIGAQPYGGQHIAFGDGTNASAFLQSSTFSWWSSDTAISLMPSMGSGGNVGINTTTPASRLQIGSVGSTSYANDDIAFGNGTNASGLAQTATAGQWYSTTNILLMPKNGAGDVGIGITTPANLLQIGSVGSSGFSGNQFAFGTSANASAINQSDVISWWLSTTDMILEPDGNMTLQSGGNIFMMPNGGNGHGRVGVNTSSPGYPLEVDDTVSSSFARNGYFGDFGESSDCSSSCSGGSTGFNVGIFTFGDVLAAEFDTFSDARIKNVRGKSDSARDLATLDAIEVTDYTMKDKVRYGDERFKKVIAQQVEKIYPQVVSKHTDFIPDVYQVASSVEPADGGYRLRFAAPHGIGKAAKKLKLLPEGASVMQQVDILSIPTDQEVIVKASGWTAERVFVYGEQVDDFRTVDYEGLAALNISATQELSKKVEGQLTAMQELRDSKDAQIADLHRQLDAQREQLAALESMASDLRDVKAQVAKLKRQQSAGATLQTAMQP